MVNRKFKFQISQNRLAKFRLRQKISLTAQASWCQPLMSSEATLADYESRRRASISTTRSPLKKVQTAKLLSQGMSRLKHRIRATRQLSLTGQSLRPLTMTNTLMPMAGESKTLKTVWPTWTWRPRTPLWPTTVFVTFWGSMWRKSHSKLWLKTRLTARLSGRTRIRRTWFLISMSAFESLKTPLILHKLNQAVACYKTSKDLTL